MGYLFENAEKMDIQAERQNTKEERERADAAELRFNQAIDNFILHEKVSAKTKEDVSESLQTIYGMTEADAKKRIGTLWT